MAKFELSLDRAHRLLSPTPALLVTTARKDKMNVAPATWAMPISARPAMVCVALHPATLTHDLVKASGEFVLNIPSEDMARWVKYCGSVSGRDVDKFAHTGLHIAEPRAVRAPLIEECIGHLECSVVETVTPGEHTLYIAEVVYVWVESEAFDDAWKLLSREMRPLYHLGASYFGAFDKRVEVL